MKDSFIAFDQRLVGVYEAFSWRCEYYLMKDCFDLARIMRTIVAILATIKYPVLLPVWVIVWCGIGVSIWFVENLVRSKPHRSNPMRSAYQLRLVALVYAIVLTGMFIVARNWSAFMLMGTIQCLLVSMFCFMSCNPMPGHWTPQSKRLVLVPTST